MFARLLSRDARRRRSPAVAAARWGRVALACSLALAAIPARADDGRKKRVLLLNSYHAGYVWSDQITATVRHEFERSGLGVDLHVEYMDTKQHQVEQVFPHLEALYQAKYSNLRFDLVMACDENALNFLLPRRGKLFPGVPVVFCGINNVDDVRITGQRDIAGVAEDFDLEGTLALALRLHPKTARIAFVSDSTSTGRANLKRAERVMRECWPDLQYEALAELTTEELVAALRKLSPDTVLVHLHFLRDRDGRTYSAKESVALVEAHCAAPIYTMWEHRLGPGTLGGVVTGGTVQGENVARMALRILRGEPAEGIGILRRCPTRTMFNYARMEQFGIRPSDLPRQTAFFNRPFSIYQEYKGWIWATLGAMGLLLSWIALLHRSIRQRRRAQRALREANDMLTSIIESSPLPIVALDRQGKVTLWSPAAERLLGWSRQEAMGQVNPAVAPERRDRFLAGIQDVLSGRHVTAVEDRHVHKDGTEMDVSVFGAPLHDAGGRIIGAIGVIEDITGRKHAERQRRELEAKVQHAQKLESLGVLAGGIAHDFNNLLVGILGNADLALAEMPPDAELRGTLEEVRTAALRASELTRQMLTYSGRGPSDVERVDLNELVRQTAQLLHASISKKVTLTYELADDLPAIRADASQLRQVVMNLLTNASDAIGQKQGAITLGTSLRPVGGGDLAGTYPPQDLPAGRYVRLEVADTGCGMDEQTRRRIFEPFFTTKFAGRGLGMAAVLGIVRGHGGAIEVDSHPGRGSVFHVYLPACEAAPAPQPAAEPAAPREWRGSGTVLVVDDEAMVCNVAKAMLERLGFAVLTAQDGQEGLEIFRLRAGQVAAVLLDMTMPRMSGRETLRRMRRIRPDVKVIVASGYGEQDAALQFAGDGPTAFVHKPFDLAQIAAKLQEVVRA